MLCGCSKLPSSSSKKPPNKSSPVITSRDDDDNDSMYGLLPPTAIPQSPAGAHVASESWCPALKPDHPTYPRMQQYQHSDKCALSVHQEKCALSMYQNQGFDSGIDTGSSPDSGHSKSRSGQTVKILDPYGAQPLLEVSERLRGSTSTLNGRHSRMLQNYRGQLKLAVYFNSGLLTLHVKQAKHLTSKWSALPCPYVKVALIPDDQARCKTDVQTDTDRPRFDEKFSFEIGDEDFDKRIYVAVCSKDPNHNRGEVLGCMSFGVHNIVRGKTSVHGWYFLLSDHIGRRKHLQAESRRHLATSKLHLATSKLHLASSKLHLATDSSSAYSRRHLADSGDYDRSPLVVDEDFGCELAETTSCSEFSTVVEDIAPLSSTLHMSRGPEGYGFTLSGGCPAHILTIEPASPADHAGLRVGDSVLTINNHDVSRATANTVARILRYHQEVDVEVVCTPTPTPSPVSWRGSTPVNQHTDNNTRGSTPVNHHHDNNTRGSTPVNQHHDNTRGSTPVNQHPDYNTRGSTQGNPLPKVNPRTQPIKAALLKHLSSQGTSAGGVHAYCNSRQQYRVGHASNSQGVISSRFS